MEVPGGATVRRILLVLLSMLTFAAAAQTPDEATITEAYVYLLGRALVIRQEHIDLKEPGVTYNKIKYNPLGSADFVNPNFDVAYLEAWFAVDDKTPVVLEVPLVMKPPRADADDPVHHLEVIEILEQMCIETPGGDPAQSLPGEKRACFTAANVSHDRHGVRERRRDQYLDQRGVQLPVHEAVSNSQ